MDMLDWILKVLPIASFLLATLSYITNEMRARRKEREEREQSLEKENGALPPRKETHRKR